MQLLELHITDLPTPDFWSVRNGDRVTIWVDRRVPEEVVLRLIARELAAS